MIKEQKKKPMPQKREQSTYHREREREIVIEQKRDRKQGKSRVLNPVTTHDFPEVNAQREKREVLWLL